MALDDEFSNELIGVWIGVADIRGGKQLVVLDYKLDEKSELVSMINGSDAVNQAPFNNYNVSFVDGVTQIPTTHATYMTAMNTNCLFVNCTSTTINGKFPYNFKRRAAELSIHEGQVIFAGVLNTWSNARVALIRQPLNRLNLIEVKFFTR